MSDLAEAVRRRELAEQVAPALLAEARLVPPSVLRRPLPPPPPGWLDGLPFDEEDAAEKHYDHVEAQP